MRAMTWGMMLAALTLLIGPRAALGCDIQGTVVCQRASASDPVVPLVGVKLVFADQAGFFETYPSVDRPDLPAPTDASGWFHFITDAGATLPGTWSVTLDLSSVGGPPSFAYGSIWIPYVYPTVTLAPFEIGADVLPLVCGGGSSGGCDLSSVPSGALPCEDRPWGNPRAECAKFGNFVPVGDGFVWDGSILRAKFAADFAIVKSGRACYAITENVSIGDALNLPLAYGVSHVTYCSCPPAK